MTPRNSREHATVKFVCPLLLAMLAGSSASCGDERPAAYTPPVDTPPPAPVSNPMPIATSLSPASVSAGDGRFTLTVTGSRFVASTVIRWNGADRPTVVASSTVLRAAIPASDVAVAGPAALSVYTPPPGGGTSAAGTLIVAPKPTQAVAYQIDAAHSGRAAQGTPLVFPAAPAWQVTLDGSVSYPLIAEGKAFVLISGAGGGKQGARLYAFDLPTGTTAWGPVAIGGFYNWAGHAYDDGKILVVDFLGELRALDAATGAQQWTILLPDPNWQVDAPPTASSGIVYVGAAYQGGTLYAVDERNGHILWAKDVWNGNTSSPAIGPEGVFVSYPCQVYEFNRFTGEPLWRFNGPCEGGGGKTAAYFRGSLYVRDIYLSLKPGTPPYVGHIYDSYDGNETGIFGYTPTVFPIPAFDEKGGYIVSNGALNGMYPDMLGYRWTFPGDRQLASAPIVVDDAVFVASKSGTVYAVDAEVGTERWSAAAGASIEAPDEQNTLNQPLPGLAAGEGYLLVPAGKTLTAWRIATP